MLLDRFFKKKAEIIEDDFVPKLCELDERCPESIDWDSVPEPILPDIIDPTKKNLLILDDITATNRMFTIDFTNIHKEYNVDIEQDYNIIKCFGPSCGFTAEKFIETSGYQVDAGILDISIGNNVKLKRGNIKEIDGIDIYNLIKSKNEDSKVIFMTGHAVTMKNKDCVHYFEKFNSSGENIEDHYYNKQDSNRSEKLYKFLYGHGE